MFSIFYKVVCLLANTATRHCQILKKKQLIRTLLVHTNSSAIELHD